MSDEQCPPTFEEVVAQQQAHVARLARRLLGWSTATSGDVDDVVQDVFLAVLGALPGFRGDSSVATWVTRITVNACRRHRRKRALRAALWDRWVRGAAASRGVEAAPGEIDETSARVRNAVARLPGKYREVVVLRYLEGMQADEIGCVLGASRGAVEVRLHRAREMLKGELKSLVDES